MHRRRQARSPADGHFERKRRHYSFSLLPVGTDAVRAELTSVGSSRRLRPATVCRGEAHDAAGGNIGGATDAHGPPTGEPGDQESRVFVIVSRQALIESRFSAVVCAPVYTRRDGLATQVDVGIGDSLAPARLRALDQALRVALALA
jgi:hypothetical protein